MDLPKSLWEKGERYQLRDAGEIFTFMRVLHGFVSRVQYHVVSMRAIS